MSHFARMQSRHPFLFLFFSLMPTSYARRSQRKDKGASTVTGPSSWASDLHQAIDDLNVTRSRQILLINEFGRFSC